MVTDPDFTNSDSVVSFLKDIQTVIRYLGISTADMEKGSMRLEANISVRKAGERNIPDYKVELKNINSFRFLKKAIDKEIERQEEIISLGKKIVQETRGWNEKKGETQSQRVKEEALDYRYFPDPDIPPISLEPSVIQEIKSRIPELPHEKAERFKKVYGIPENFITILVESSQRADYFESAAKLNSNFKTIADLMVNKNMDSQFPEPGGLVKKIVEISGKEFTSQEDVMNAVDDTLSANQKAVGDYRKGKSDVIGYLIGQVQKILEGNGNPIMIREILLQKLK